MKIGLCTSIDNAPVAHDAGFDYVEENVQNLLIAEQSEEAFDLKLKAVHNSPLPVFAACAFLPGALKCVGPKVDGERLVRYAETSFRRANETGIEIVVFGSGAARQITDGYSPAKARDQFLSYVKEIAPLAKAHDVTLVIECLNKKECNFLNALAEGAALVEEVGHPHVQLLADIYHMRVEGESASEIVKYGGMIRHVHVAELEGRQAPGTSGEDFGPFLRALKEIDYQGAVSFECGWQQLSEQAAGSLKGFREQIRAAGLV